MDLSGVWKAASLSLIASELAREQAPGEPEQVLQFGARPLASLAEFFSVLAEKLFEGYSKPERSVKTHRAKYR